ncbi:MAG: hypothetical protein CMF74_14965 [Maricaulis sp.]|jgi:hypothetical protein|nr:hypothetical protein [Maricaulis sp.]HAQ33845.1 hypothetical protein [Alphaproteobacteria bacterium]
MSDGAAPRYAWLGRAAIEALLIVFAVVLGFLVNEWRENVADRHAANTALERIIEEMDANAGALRQVVGYHEEVAGRLGEAIARIERGEAPEEGVLFDVLPAIIDRGIQEPRLTSVAWDYAQARGDLDPVEYGLIADIALIYNAQAGGADSTWRSIADTFFGTVDSLESRPLIPRLRLMQFAFHELAAQERYLIGLYDRQIEDVREALE